MTTRRLLIKPTILFTMIEAAMHNEIDRYFIKEKLGSGTVYLPYIYVKSAPVHACMIPPNSTLLHGQP